MAYVSLIVCGSPAVHLEPDIIYRIGRKKGLEISIADESMELAHATACILRRGVVRLAAMVGSIFVNDQEKTVADISKAEAFDGTVKLRFGNVEARLEIRDENDEAHDSSGFGECPKDRSNNSTMDSFNIPETQPPSANTSANTSADSFFIPETQAVNFERPSTSGKVSLGDDFMIPETQDLLAELPSVQFNDPVINHKELSNDADFSQGSEIRICTQDFNEDAIDDFDSSQILCDAMLDLPLPRPIETLEKKDSKRDQLNATDLEMSALNWSASNSKSCALSSTAILPSGDACITPELSAPSEDRPICTPDLFDLILGNEPRSGSNSPDPFVRPSNVANTTTPQFGGVKQLVVATIETPTATPDKEDAASSQEMNQDSIVTQRFPENKLLESESEDEDVPNQDFVATQAFKLGRPQQDKVPNSPKDNETNQDFIATQAFNFRRPQPPDSPKAPRANTNCNQDFIATQAFPANINSSRCQDFIETQQFNPGNQNSLSFGNKENIPHDNNTEKAAGSKSVEEPCDEIDAVLNEMISGTIVTSPVNPNEEPIKFFKPCVIKDKNHFQKVCQIEGVFGDISNKRRWRSEGTRDGSRKRVARSESPPETPSRKNRRTSEGSQGLEYNLRKRRATSVDKKSEPLNKFICKEHDVSPHTEEKDKDDKINSPFKVMANKWQARRSIINNRSGTPGNSLETNKVEDEMQAKSKDELSATPSIQEPSSSGANAKEPSVRAPRATRATKSRSTTPSVDDLLPSIEEPSPSGANAKGPEVRAPRATRATKSRSTTPSIDELLPCSASDKKPKIVTAKKETRKPGRKTKVVETNKADTCNDIPRPITKTRRNTSQVDDALSEKERKVESADVEVVETPDAEKPVKSKRGRKAKNLETSKEGTSKEMAKPMSTTRRQTSEEEVKKPNAGGGTEAENAETNIANSSYDTPKPMTKTRRKASVEDVEDPKAEKPVKSEKGRKARNVEANRADTSKDMPKVMTRNRRKTIVEDAETMNDEKPMETSLKRVVVRIPRASVDKIETSSTSGTSSRVTSAAKSPSIEEPLSSVANSKVRGPKLGSATPSIEEPSSSGTKAKGPAVRAPRANRSTKSRSATPSVDDASDKKLKTEAAIEKPSTSSTNTKKAKTSSNEEVPMNRSGATTTRFSQPDPDSLKAFNQYVRKAKTDGKIKIAFTMCNRPALESVLKSLKHVVEITEDPVQCDLLIMDKGERTYKFLIAIASNKPVLSTNWLHSVKKTRTIEVKADHIFSDAKFEETMKFKPLSVLQHTRLLSGLHFMLGEDIIPKPIELKVIIQSAGGKVLTQPPSLAFSVELYVVTTSKDHKFHRRLRNHEKVHFIKTEGVMQALVRHNAELLNEHKLKV
ncbi:mediator of DNA damage checkpoint protein 1-like isoform X1 [Drosophila rhopaloa]|uniref:Mediator of DNA damage checkpoint protein 1 n=1 Tax=Drosophila rhopaloa TaxID=1041015 RepID=A0ABM5J418_DRORH|nr:mediator of DNA damage checkpoint protein 1-like isoform X1 [Drosophila rhopaloa]